MLTIQERQGILGFQGEGPHVELRTDLPEKQSFSQVWSRGELGEGEVETEVRATEKIWRWGTLNS